VPGAIGGAAIGLIGAELSYLDKSRVGNVKLASDQTLDSEKYLKSLVAQAAKTGANKQQLIEEFERTRDNIAEAKKFILKKNAYDKTLKLDTEARLVLQEILRWEQQQELQSATFYSRLANPDDATFNTEMMALQQEQNAAA